MKLASLTTAVATARSSWCPTTSRALSGAGSGPDPAGGAGRLGGRCGRRCAGSRASVRRRASPAAFALDTAQLGAPLPRAYQWADGSAYVNHVELVRKARGAEMPRELLDRPADVPGRLRRVPRRRATRSASPTRPGASTSRPRSPSSSTTCRWASRPKRPRGHIQLLMLVNDVSLRNLIPAELAKGFGFFQTKPSSAFSPVAVTPDELGDAWDGGSCICRCFVAERHSRSAARRRRRHDLRFPHPDRACRQDAAARAPARSSAPARSTKAGPATPIAEGGVGCPASPSSARSRPSRRRAAHAVPALRRSRADRDARRAGPLDLRRHRPAGGALFWAA